MGDANQGNALYGPVDPNRDVHLTAGPPPAPENQVTPTEIAAKMSELAGLLEKIKRNGGTPPAGAETLLLTNPQSLANDPVALGKFNEEVVKSEMQASGELLKENAGKALGCILCATDISRSGLGFLTEALGLPPRPALEGQGFPLQPLPI